MSDQAIRKTPETGEIHNVVLGESVPSIAYERGHFWETIWEHPQNQELCDLRKDPNILQEGDKVFIPPIKPKPYSRKTILRHRFRLKGVPSILRLRLMEPPPREINTLGWLLKSNSSEGANNPATTQIKPWVGVEFQLTVDGKESKGQSDKDGVISVIIQPNAKSGRLIIAKDTKNERTIELNLGHIHPITTFLGVRERLQNLGFPVSENDATEEDLSDTIASFQRVYKLPITGNLDDETRDKLQESHGS